MNENSSLSPKPLSITSLICRLEPLLFLLPLALPIIAWQLGRIIGNYWITTWFSPVFFLLIIPCLDHWIGESTTNPPEAFNHQFSASPIARTLPMLTLPCWIGVFFWGLSLLDNFNALQLIGWAITLSFIGGICLINVAHELIHRNTKLERAIGGLLLASILNLTFKIEHIRGHHRHLATAKDHSTAVFGDSVYRFMPKAIMGNFHRTWQLERARIQAQGLTWFSTDIIPYGLYSLLLATMISLLFGIKALVFFIIVSVITNALLEVINYIEHYGLSRQQGTQLVPIGVEHSWNSNSRLSNALVLNLQRHSDHHVNAARPYPSLRNLPNSPQLPYGYAAMISIALLPPLWRRVMDPRVLALKMPIQQN